jgi:DedD protein
MKRESIPLEALADLKRQARRRLIGSVVLLSIALMVLWNVVSNHKPQEPNRDIFIQKTPDAQNTDLSKMEEAIPNLMQEIAENTDSSVASQSQVGSHDLPKGNTFRNVDQPKSTLPAAPVLGSGVSSDYKKNIQRQESINSMPDGKTLKKVNPKDILEGRFDPDVSDDPPLNSSMQVSKKNPNEKLKNKKWIIQLAALSDEKKIEFLRLRLNEMGVPSHFSHVETSKGKMTRIRVGPFSNKKDADAMISRLNQQSLSGIMISESLDRSS